eukprot:3097297-Amphidinium_carterae.2
MDWPSAQTLTVSTSSKAALWDRLPVKRECFCDVSVRCSDGKAFEAHWLLLSMASEPLSAMLTGDFAEAHQRDVRLESNTEAMRVFLEFLYKGESLVKPDATPELLEFAHKREVKTLQKTLHEYLKKLCSALIVHERALLSDDLGEMWESYALENFADC